LEEVIQPGASRDETVDITTLFSVSDGLTVTVDSEAGGEVIPQYAINVFDARSAEKFGGLFLHVISSHSHLRCCYEALV